jgi:hypothetical protein
VVRSIIWGLIGGIYGGLFIGFKELMISLGHAEIAVIPAAALAGAVGAAFYGSIRVAMLGTLAGLFSGVTYLLAISEANIQHLAILAGFCGVAVGFIYGTLRPAVSGALMKSLTGLVSGGMAGALIWFIGTFGIAISDVIVAGILAPLTGTFYIFWMFKLVDKMQCKLPLPLVGAIVAGLLSVVVAGSVWVIQGALLEAVDAVTVQSQNGSFGEILACITCAIAGGAIVGGNFAMIGLRWLRPD